MKKKKARLVLRRETIQRLDEPALRQAPGGVPGDSCTSSPSQQLLTVEDCLSTPCLSAEGCLGINTQKTVRHREGVGLR
jgi:hypothetical protein